MTLQGALIISHQLMLQYWTLRRLSKKVPHRHLLHKVQHYGISSNMISQLPNRIQIVVVDGQSSPFEPVLSGVKFLKALFWGHADYFVDDYLLSKDIISLWRHPGTECVCGLAEQCRTLDTVSSSPSSANVFVSLDKILSLNCFVDLSASGRYQSWEILQSKCW